jgi:hypothetical protein
MFDHSVLVVILVEIAGGILMLLVPSVWEEILAETPIVTFVVASILVLVMFGTTLEEVEAIPMFVDLALITTPVVDFA